LKSRRKTRRSDHRNFISLTEELANMSCTHNRAAKHAALPLAACAVAALSAFAAPSASAQALQAQRIVIDPYTGRARMPEHDELAAAAAQAQAARAAARTNAPAENSVKALLANHPAFQNMTAVKPTAAFAGSQGRQIGLERLSFSVVRRDANGQISNQCVTGSDAADKALHGALVGDAHDH
jgi:hypothetical protein